MQKRHPLASTKCILLTVIYCMECNFFYFDNKNEPGILEKLVWNFVL